MIEYFSSSCHSNRYQRFVRARAEIFQIGYSLRISFPLTFRSFPPSTLPKLLQKIYLPWEHKPICQLYHFNSADVSFRRKGITFLVFLNIIYTCFFSQQFINYKPLHEYKKQIGQTFIVLTDNGTERKLVTEKYSPFVD